jgi:hypothetical protein
MLLLFGIPVFVWMKWRQKKEPVEAWTDPDVALLRRAYTPPPKPPVVAHDEVEATTPIGLGVD